MVVSDTSPLNYLILIDVIGVLPQLYGEVWISETVRAEMAHPAAPLAVRNFASAPPDWLSCRPDLPAHTSMLHRLDPGEAAAISLAEEFGPDALLIDDRSGVIEARIRGLEVIGTLGILDAAADRELIDLRSSLDKLLQTSFRMPRAVREMLLKRWDSR